MAEDKQKKSKRSKASPDRPSRQGSQGSPQPPQQGFSLLKIILVAVVVYLLIQWGMGVAQQGTRIAYSAFRQQLRDDNIAQVLVRGERIKGTFKKRSAGT